MKRSFNALYFIKILFACTLLFLFLVRYKKIFFIIVFFLIIFLVRYQRMRMNIPFTLEPVIVLSVVVLRAYGILPAVVLISIPNLLSDLFSGKFGIFSIVFAVTKVIVIFPIFFFGYLNLFYVTLVSYVLINEILGNLITLHSGGEIKYIISGLATSTLIRIIYLKTFLDPLCFLVGC